MHVDQIAQLVIIHDFNDSDLHDFGLRLACVWIWIQNFKCLRIAAACCCLKLVAWHWVHRFLCILVQLNNLVKTELLQLFALIRALFNTRRRQLLVIFIITFKTHKLAFAIRLLKYRPIKRILRLFFHILIISVFGLLHRKEPAFLLFLLLDFSLD